MSPLLFVLAADFLQSLINKGKDLGLLNLPIPMQTNKDFPVIQYADDTLIVLEGDTRQLLFLKSIINTFSEATGLKVNFTKSMMLPINMSDERLDFLARTFGCSKGSFPFTYLGLPLSLTKPSVQEYLPLISKCERRLGSVTTFLSQAVRLEITNAVFTALPTFYMCTLELPKEVIKRIDTFRKHCLWRGNEANAKKAPKAAWKMVCKSKEEGGLGIINIEKQNEALLLKNLDKFYNKRDIPRVQMVWEKYYSNGKLPGATRKGSFCWRNNLKNLSKYKEMAALNLQNGESTLFWQDRWNGQPLESEMPELHSYAKNRKITAKQAMNTEDLTHLFHLPISETAFSQLQQMIHLLQQRGTSSEQDLWTYSWGQKFSAAKAYKYLMGHQHIHNAFRWLWKNSCQPKQKIFFWLLISDRLSTRNILRRRHMHSESYNCVLCMSSPEETVRHLFLDCPFARQCWQFIQVDIPLSSSFPEVSEQIRDQIQTRFFMVAIILICWTIWSSRNKLIFDGILPSVPRAKEIFQKELTLLKHRVKSSLSPQFDQWVLNILNLL